MHFDISSSASNDDVAEETENGRNEESEEEPEVKTERNQGRSSEAIAEENYTRTKAYIYSDEGKGMDVTIVNEPDLTANILNAYADEFKATTKNKNCRKEGVFVGVTDFVDGLLGKQTSRTALSKMVELFTLIVDLHAATGIELLNAERTVGLTECLRLMTGEYLSEMVFAVYSGADF